MRKLPVFAAAAAAVLTMSGVPMTAQAATSCPTSGNGFYVSNYGTNCSQFGDLNSILSRLGCSAGTGTKGAAASSASGSCSKSNCLSGNCFSGSDCQGGNGCKTGSSCLNGNGSCITGSGCSNGSNGSSCSGNKSLARYWR